MNAMQCTSRTLSQTQLYEMGTACRDAMAEAQEEDTPLKQKLDEFGTFLSKVHECADVSRIRGAVVG